MKIDELEKRLLAVADASQAQPMKAYMKTILTFWVCELLTAEKWLGNFSKNLSLRALTGNLLRLAGLSPTVNFNISPLITYYQEKDLVLADLPRLKN